MAHLIKQKNSINWYIRYKHNGKWIKKCLNIPNLKIAKRALLDYQLLEAKQSGLDFIIIEKPVKEIIEGYRKDVIYNANFKDKSGNTKRIEKPVLRFIEGYCSKNNIIKILQFTPSHAKGYLNERGLKVSPSVINREKTILKSFFNYAIENKFLNDNPAVGIPNKKTVKKIFRNLNQKDIINLFIVTEKLKPWWLPAIGLGYYAGLRKTEVLFFEFKDVDFEKNIVYVRWKPGSEIKNRKERAIPLSRKLKKILLEARKRWENPVEVKVDGKKYYYDLVFRTNEGKHHGNNFDRKFAVLTKNAGLKDVSFQTLRETFGSVSLDKIKDPRGMYLVSKWLGHSSIKVTEDHYIYLDIVKTNKDVNRL